MNNLEKLSTNMESHNTQHEENKEKKENEENKEKKENKENKEKRKKKKKSYKSLMKSYLKSNYTEEQRIENQKRKLDTMLVDANFKKVDVI